MNDIEQAINTLVHPHWMLAHEVPGSIALAGMYEKRRPPAASL